ncbi:MAG TPA: hypothetical protein VKR55_22450 [Bradyrhizobium sp.]|uniref:hypothetical protein n=1 Tax=Bradyrhizobium sp. TaxID=376 RepID=UPI002BE47E98|nr:hypothetical protein [Bradyrhizobium sp.]HLZ04898.1 hypothetical protein [Bradyrhizobium sp.]
MTEGWFRNQTRNQALHDGTGDPLQLTDALGPKMQLDAIATLDLAGAFELGGAQLILHSDPLPTSTPGPAVLRRTGSTAPCYAEFVIRRLVYAKNALAGGALQGFFTLRVFGAGDIVTHRFASTADTPLMLFPWKAPGDAESGRNELRNALRTDVLAFAAYWRKAPPKQR